MSLFHLETPHKRNVSLVYVSLSLKNPAHKKGQFTVCLSFTLKTKQTKNADKKVSLLYVSLLLKKPAHEHEKDQFTVCLSFT